VSVSCRVVSCRVVSCFLIKRSGLPPDTHFVPSSSSRGWNAVCISMRVELPATRRLTSSNQRNAIGASRIEVRYHLNSHPCVLRVCYHLAISAETKLKMSKDRLMAAEEGTPLVRTNKGRSSRRQRTLSGMYVRNPPTVVNESFGMSEYVFLFFCPFSSGRALALHIHIIPSPSADAWIHSSFSHPPTDPPEPLGHWDPSDVSISVSIQ
jgi:hypothetical protein